VYIGAMLNLNSVMVGSSQPDVLAAFYKKVFGKAPDMEDGGWSGWMVGSCFFSVGAHSEVKGKSKEPPRLMFNFETTTVEKEFKRLVAAGATVVKEPYDMGGMKIATLADPDGNYFQLMPPWEGNK
jgi:predicted enzyme related to lactoylglutathione lyase